MKLLVIIFSLMMINISFASEQEGGIHTENFCSVDNTCAHARFEAFPTTSVMSEFIIHLIPSSSNSSITNVSAKLWMDMGHGHGHGSAPLEVKTMSEANHYFVSNAWFVMTGPWNILVSFEVNGVAQNITIPLEIK
jgi:hypothetical protein